MPPEIRTERTSLDWGRGWLGEERAKGSAPKPRGPLGPTMEELRPKWIKMRKEALVDGKPAHRPATIAGYEWHMRAICKVEEEKPKPIDGKTPVATIDEQIARDWVRRTKAECAPNTCWNLYSTFRQFIDDAMVEKWVALPTNPLAHPTVLREMPPRKVLTGKRPLFIELEHMQTMLLCPEIPAFRRVRHLVQVCHGLAEGELAGRTWRDRARGPRPTLEISSSLALRGPAGYATLGETKNEYRDRTIPVHAAAAAALDWWEDVGWEQYVGRRPTLTDPIFPGPSGKFSRPRAGEDLRKDLRTAGCPDTCNGHPLDARALRRCFSTYLDAADVPEEVRGRLMGHTPKSVTAKHYTAEQIETDRRAINRIALRWVPPEGLVANLVAPPPKSQTRVRLSLQIKSAPETTRTSDQRFRKPLLYPLSYGGNPRETAANLARLGPLRKTAQRPARRAATMRSAACPSPYGLSAGRGPR